MCGPGVHAGSHCARDHGSESGDRKDLNCLRRGLEVFLISRTSRCERLMCRRVGLIRQGRVGVQISRPRTTCVGHACRLVGSTLKILEILSIIPWSLCPIGVTIKSSAACVGGACAVALKGFADSKRSSNVFAWDSTFRLFGSRRLLRRTDDHHLALFSHLDRVQAGAVPRQVCGRARIWRERGAPSLTLQVLPEMRERGQHATGLGPQLASLPVK